MKHEMKLDNKPYTNIKKGTKTIELRLNDEKRRLLNINDEIVFTNRLTNEKLKVSIENIYQYKNFEELYKHFNKEELGYKKDDKPDPKDMEKYYSKEMQNKYGVLAIKIKEIN